MEQIAAWLAATKASSFIQNVSWIIPTVQSIHILSVCVVMSSVLLLNLRLIGLLGSSEPFAAFTGRYLPWIWTALAILFVTGSILILGEPNRDLNNTTFWAKMALLFIAVMITLILEQPVKRNGTFWDRAPRRRIARALAVLALSCWIGIVLCGRWIAYSYSS